MIRKHFAGFAASALALAVSAQAFAGTVTTDGADLVIKTKGGLEVGTTDKEFSFKINGRLQVDADSFDGFYTKNGERADETYLRRARLEISGVAFTDWGYTFQRNFGDDSSNWRELAIHYNGWEPVQISVGRIRPTFGLEWATSSKWITAIERSALSDLAPWVNSEDGEGIRVRTTVGMFHGEAGAYRQDADMLEDENGANNTSFVLRGVIAPIVEKDQVLHLGASFGQRDLEEGYLERIRPRLSVRGTTEDSANGNRATFGGTVTDGSDQVWGLEAAYMIGPFSVQGEYRTRTVDAMEGFEDLEATGYNVQLAYTLTGESRSYKLDGGKFDKITPNNKQVGAWEVFYRFEDITVDETGVAPSGYVGALDSAKAGAKTHTVGVNWYANEAVKISANYLKTSVDDVVNANGDDDGDAISLRAQYVF
ncbi:outer membrane porin OprO [Ectopseudomonas oleovorans]|uniref:Outer membrane porin OprO n=1 Tax=Ectopseudomonas oleovorans TaxID=301 RepID=A0A379K9C5_ECTOL|nr:porin [Pseudomonas oleovorans]SUD61316.1 outer membrane porin OprO [Pseudomonas oleovorans]